MNEIEKGSPRVLCAISHGLYEPWLSILNDGQKKTWLAEPFPACFEVLHFHATPVSGLFKWLDKTHEKLRWTNRYVAWVLATSDNLFLFPLLSYIPRYSESRMLSGLNKSIHIAFPDTYLTYRWKLLSLLKYFLIETDSDFLLLTTTASYIRPKLALKFAERIPRQGIYAGAEPYANAGFISGSNRLISRAVASQILEARRKWKPGIIEDVALTQLIKDSGNSLITFPITNISSVEELNDTTDARLLESYHFRLKSFKGQLRNDVTIMIALHKRILRITEA